MAENTDLEELKILVIERLKNISEIVTNRHVDLEDVVEEVEGIMEAICVLDSALRLPENIFRDALNAKVLLESIAKSRSRTPRLFSGVRGRPSYGVAQQQIESLLDVGFKVGEIADLLQVSKRTIERRMTGFGLSARSFTDITNDNLDSQVREIKLYHPNIGSKNLAGFLAARSIKLPRQRVRESLQRVDPLGVAARKSRAIHRRVYCVSRPLALWHFDGNHKLVRWRFVVHGCVDGFSRIPVYLDCHTDNTAATVFQSFVNAVQQWGLPSRVRCDKGGENIDVVKYMIDHRGAGRGSALVGRSVHNQRIERLWRDVYRDVLDLFHGIFTSMEDIGILDPINETDLWCLHYSFCGIINQKLKAWVNAWIRHPLSSEHNQTPIQLWVRGQFDNAGRLNMEHPTVNEDYGIDWDGPLSADSDDTVCIEETHCPLSQNALDQLAMLYEQNQSENPSPWECVSSYQFVRNFMLQQ